MTEARPILVVADDLTGANATAAGLTRLGLRTLSVSHGDNTEPLKDFVSRFDAVVVSTNSRHMSSSDAAKQVRSVVHTCWPVRFAALRIDSTLRGNIGPTTEALLEEVSALSGNHPVALCVPAHPAAGRQTVGGMQLLRGRRLEETELADDHRSPIDDSGVTTLFSGLRTESIPLEIVTGPEDRLVGAIETAIDVGAEVLVVDAWTTDDIDRIARCAVDVERVTWVSVDPGPATVAMASTIGFPTTGEEAPLLAVSGSATELTRQQLASLQAARDVVVVPPALDERLPQLPDVDASSARLAAAMESAAPDQILLFASALNESDVVPGVVDTVALPSVMARCVRRALEGQRIDGVFATGGDITAALFAELGAHGLDVMGEVEPLAVTGELVGGPWAGLPIVTKGGLVGEAGTIIACIDQLRHANEVRSTPASRRPQASGWRTTEETS